MTFTNNMKGTHTFTDGNTVDLTVMPADEPIVIPKQPVLGGVGGNPFIWVQFIGADGAALSSEIFVGRCVQGAGWHVTQSAVTTASAVATFTVESCANSPGPYISFTSGVTMAGLSARIIFRNNDNPVGGPHEADVTRDVAVIPRSEEHTSELQSQSNLVCRLLLEKKTNTQKAERERLRPRFTDATTCAKGAVA